MNMTWPCGTPRSTNNAFCLSSKSGSKVIDNFGRIKTERQILLDATRVNSYSDSGRSTGLTNSEKAPR